MYKICLITCYMGPLPNYFSYFISSCKKNADIQFIVINDTIKESVTMDNIKLIRMNLEELSQLCTDKLNTQVKVANAWKINEFKPAFGVIFDDEIKSSDFWGWCDLDIIWGNIRSFITSDLLKVYDVIVPKAHWTAGHFTLLRNTPFNNNLFRLNPGVINLFNDETYYAFEECCHRWDGKFRSIDFLLAENLKISMFDIVKNAEAQGMLKAYFKDIIREHPQPINYSYRDGHLTDLSNQDAFMYFHLLTIKKIWRFYIPDYKTVSDTLYMTPFGIMSGQEKESIVHHLIWRYKRALGCAEGIFKSVRKQGVKKMVKRIFSNS